MLDHHNVNGTECKKFKRSENAHITHAQIQFVFVKIDMCQPLDIGLMRGGRAMMVG